MNEDLRSTVKACPVIAIATIGINIATQWDAKLFGIELSSGAIRNPLAYLRSLD